jgi:hypothetical protein
MSTNSALGRARRYAQNGDHLIARLDQFLDLGPDRIKRPPPTARSTGASRQVHE